MSVLYNTWSTCVNLPIECLVNTVLLYNEQRNIIKMDTTYYNKEQKECVQFFLSKCTGIIIKKDFHENNIVYLEKNKMEIEIELKKLGCGEVECAFRTPGFADMLDAHFYSCKADLSSIFDKNREVHVSINVIQSEEKSGPILFQMTDTCLENHLVELYERFNIISKKVEEIDNNLQTSLTFHTKPGPWKNTPELFVSRYKVL